MTIYVATAGTYSDYHIVGVFTTREGAESAAARHAEEYGGSRVEEYEADTISYPAGRNLYRVSMLRDGSPRGSRPAYQVSPSLDPEYGPKEGFRIIAWSSEPRYLEAVVWATDEQHALKIANEQRVQMIASGEWDAKPVPA